MNPIDPPVRLAIAQWPQDAPRGAVSTFCAEHGISRKSFYELRKRARSEGPAAVHELRSRRPSSSPSKLTEQIKDQAIQVRAALEAAGLDHGPISVHDKMTSMGLPVVPFTASLARIFRERGLARAEPKKRPRSAWRRFVYPAPNACWQWDATEYVLTTGRKCVIIQLLDDHSRYALASVVAAGETARAAIAVFDRAVAVHGVPQRLLTDNGAALNPTRRGFTGQLVDHVTRLGVAGITGKPYKPTTQGKNERSARPCSATWTSSPWPRTWPACRRRSTPSTTSTTPNDLTRDCPAGVTPLTAWQATPKADRRGPTPTGPRSPTRPHGSPALLRLLDLPPVPARQRETDGLPIAVKINVQLLRRAVAR